MAGRNPHQRTCAGAATKRGPRPETRTPKYTAGMGIGSGSYRSRPSQSVLYGFDHTAQRRYPFVQRAFPWRPRLPAPVDPEPLIRILADHALEDRVQAGGVFMDIATNPHLGIEAQHEFTLLLGPEREARNHGGAGMGGQLGKSAA